MDYNIINLSNRNPLDANIILEQCKHYKPTSVTFSRSRFYEDRVKQDKDSLLAAHRLLLQYSDTLRSIDMSNSNGRGLIFYNELLLPALAKPGEISIESISTKDGTAIVRDTTATKFINHTDGNRYYYLNTTADGEEAFLRHYVRIGWLSSLETALLSATFISGLGTIALLSAAPNLTTLVLSRCNNVDDRVIYGLLELEIRLSELNLSECPQLTTHGIMALARIKLDRLTILNITLSSSLTDRTKLIDSLCYSLEERGYSGLLISERGEYKCNPLRKGSLERSYNNTTVFDLSLSDITSSTLFKALEMPNPVQVSLEDKLGNQTDPICIDCTDQFIDDNCLRFLGVYFGSYCTELILDGTFISEYGLNFLNFFPKLFRLSLTRCFNILEKNTANDIISKPIKAMKYLRIFNVQDSRISGKALFEHPNLKLVEIRASRAPFSIFAVNMILKSCANTLEILHLSGCSFMNKQCLSLISRFNVLKELDLSYCTGLSSSDIMMFIQNLPTEKLRNFKFLIIRGIVSANETNSIASLLSSRAGHPVDIDAKIESSEGRSKLFRGETFSVQQNPQKNNPESAYGSFFPSNISSRNSQSPYESINPSSTITSNTSSHFLNNTTHINATPSTPLAYSHINAYSPTDATHLTNQNPIPIKTSPNPYSTRLDILGCEEPEPEEKSTGCTEGNSVPLPTAALRALNKTPSTNFSIHSSPSFEIKETSYHALTPSKPNIENKISLGRASSEPDLLIQKSVDISNNNIISNLSDDVPN